MTIPDSYMKDEKMATEATVIAEDPEQGGGEQKTIATAVCTTESCSARDATIISIEPSIYKLATVGEVEDPAKRQANLCCGSCCDLLRACIVVNIIFVVVNALGVILSFWGISVLDNIDLGQIEDDDVVDEFEQQIGRTSLLYHIVIVQQGLGILFGVLGIVGASQYMKFLVLTAGVWYCIDFVLCAISINIPGLVLRGFFAYPHIACFLALKKGQITRETYNRERYCCCDREEY